MGTRGLVGFVVDEKVKVTYNHFDSYPDGLGVDVLMWLKGLDGEGAVEAEEQARSLKLVSEDAPPTGEELNNLERWANTSVNGGEGWYSLLRETQGDLAAILESGHMIDGIDFAADSLFCEWGYVVDFDNYTLECYKGFVRDGDRCVGRFSGLPGTDGYLPITLVAQFPLHNLPDSVTFCGILNPDYEE